MILEGNPLDLNSFPDDYSRDGMQVLQHSFPSESTEEKDGKEECGNKVYECRFCSHKICKSQALGGHMNRHRQERETETLNHARHLIFGTHHNLRLCQERVQGRYNHPGGAGGNMGELRMCMTMRFPTYLCACSSCTTHMNPQVPSHPYLYVSSTSGGTPMYFAMNGDYQVGHVLSSSTQQHQYVHHNLNYAMVGAPLGQGFTGGRTGGGI